MAKRRINAYILHEKDAKSGHRTISQMFPDMRVDQSWSEHMCAIYTDEEKADQMRDSKKASNYVTAFSDLLSKGGTCSSEDKKFFCGNINPEFLGACVHILGHDMGSTGLMGAGSNILCDTYRWMIMKPGEYSEIGGLISKIETRDCLYSGRKTNEPTKAFKTQWHMQQGIRAQAAALMSTVVGVGTWQIMSSMTEAVTDKHIFTTSDDWVRGICVHEGSRYDKRSVEIEFIHRPFGLMKRIMMMNSSSKLVESANLSEFNNMAVTRRGMMVQSPVHAHLAIQPLLGTSVIDDVVSLISGSRATVRWGDTIDVATGSIEGYIVLLRQKWLLDDQHIQSMIDKGFLPKDDEQLLEGFQFRTDHLKRIVYWTTEPGKRGDLLNGSVSMLDSIRRAANVKEKNKRARRPVGFNSTTFMQRENSEAIEKSRMLKNKGGGKYTRPIQPELRINARNKFVELLYSDLDEIPPIDSITINDLSTYEKCTIAPKSAKTSHLKPCSQGSGGKSPKEVDLGAVISKRFTGLNLRARLDVEGMDLVDIPFADFLTWYRSKVKEKMTFGFGFQSPYGLPRMAFRNGCRFTKATSFSFFMDHPDMASAKSLDYQKMTEKHSIKPLVYGGSDLKNISEGRFMMPHSMRAIPGEKGTILHEYSWEHGTKGRDSVLVEPFSTPHMTVFKGVDRIYLINPDRPDMSLVNLAKYIRIDDPPGSSLPGVCFDAIAAYNYGNWLYTNSFKAMASMDSLMRFVSGCKQPKWLQGKLPAFPYFVGNTTNITRGVYTIVEGHKCVRRLRLYAPHARLDLNEETRVVRISCSHNRPTLLALIPTEADYDEYPELGW